MKWRVTLLTASLVLGTCSIGHCELPYDVALGQKVVAVPNLPETVTRVFTDGADTRDISVTGKAAGWPADCKETTTSLMIDLGKVTDKISRITVDNFASAQLNPPAIAAVGMRAFASPDGKQWQLLGKLSPDNQKPTDMANRVTQWSADKISAGSDTRYIKVEIDWPSDTAGQKLITEVRVITPSPLIVMRGTFYFIEGKEKWTRQRFAKELDWMKEAGVDSIILMRMIHNNKAFYPTKIKGYEHLTDTDPFDYILSEASKRDMSVYVHLTDAGDYWTVTDSGYYDNLAKKLLAVADEAHTLYSKYSALKGFYLIPEFWYPTHPKLPEIWIENYLKPVTEHLKYLNPKYVICSAPFVGVESEFKAADHEQFWTQVMKRVPGLDFIAIQDGIGANEYPNGDSKARTYSYIQEVFTSAKRAMDATGRSLWCDLESFEKVYTPYPQHFSRFVDQMNASGPIVGERFFTFEWAYLSPSHSLSSAIWHQNVRRHNAGIPIWEDLSHGCSYFLTNQGVASENGMIGADISTYTPTTKLTDGGQDVATTESAIRFDRPTRAQIQLPTRHTDIEAFAVSFAHDLKNDAEWPEKIQVYASDDPEKEFRFIGTFGPPLNADRSLGSQGIMKLTKPVAARYIEFRVFPATGKKAYCAGLAVLGIGEQVLNHNRLYTLSHTPGDRFPDPNGKLTNGDFSQRGYAQVGWRKMTEPVTIDFDLESSRTVVAIDVWLLQKNEEPGDCPVSLPKKACVQISNDGRTWSDEFNLDTPGSGRIRDRQSNKCSYEFKPGSSARYVRVILTPPEDPEHWINVSEIKIYGSGQ